MTEYFPELNIHFLKLFGKRWAKRYARVPIELILLTKHNDIRFSKDYLEDEFIRREGFEPVQIKEAKYDIFFVISYDKDLFDEAKIGYTGKDVSEYHLQLIRGDKKPGALQDFLNNIEYEQNKSQAQYARLLTDGFHDDVYREPPNSILWRQDWDIHAILQNYKNDFSLPSEMEYEPYIVLYADSKWTSSLEQSNTSQNTSDQNSDSIKQNSSSILLCPSGTEWEDITITLTSEEQVRIKTPQREQLYHYAQIGMQNRRNTKKKKRIWALLMLFAQQQGDIKSDDIITFKTFFGKHGEQGLYQKFITVTKELNKHLKDLFGIDNSIYIGHYKKMFKDESSLRKYRPILFKNENIDDAIKKKDRQNMINKLLIEKGYATKINFTSTLRGSSESEPEEEKSLHEQEIDEAKRLTNQR